MCEHLEREHTVSPRSRDRAMSRRAIPRGISSFNDRTSRPSPKTFTDSRRGSVGFRVPTAREPVRDDPRRPRSDHGESDDRQPPLGEVL